MGKDDSDDGRADDPFGVDQTRDTTIQILISLAFGLIAFLTFCVLRPRWPGLFAARKKQKEKAAILPELPSSLFGWLVPLWRITDQQILASAGLDAYVFLAFFKMAMKFLLFTLVFSVLIIKPVHDANLDDGDGDVSGNKTTDSILTRELFLRRGSLNLLETDDNNGTIGWLPYQSPDYLWMYIAFAYLFTAIAVYLVVTETKKIIAVRQEYLGAQATVTDRTIRLSGVPAYLQDEEKIKEFIENLDIGKVESVTLCRNWKELDQAMSKRMSLLRRLEEVYTVHMGYRTVERSRETLPIAQPSPPAPTINSIGVSDESDTLIGDEPQSHVRPYSKPRPQTRLRYGFLGLQSRRVDAIDYYEEQLRNADDEIQQLRDKEFAPTPLAFVTMDSVAACQMVIQAVLDPSPQQLIANQSPAASDIIWPNTYLSRRNRVIRSWSITALIVFLTVFWSLIFVPIALSLEVKTIGKVFPQFAAILEEHESIRSLVNTQLPTLFVSLLLTVVPYLYYYLSWCQGQLSQGDVELSSISKNFFFTFFNFFIIFTIFGTASKFFRFYEFFKKFRDSLQNFTNIANTLALSLQRLSKFYTNYIILQGIGLFPFRLLEIGSVSLYPIYLIGAKTPRDYAELVQPPLFIYGYYLPSAMLIFIICMVYSVLQNSWQVLLAGLIYFMLGHYVYKYQLLYAMDHRQQSTGQAWIIICERVFLGLVFFQVTTTGQLLLKQAFSRSLLMIPLIAATVWVSILYRKTFKPLMRFIALSSVKRGEQYSDYTNGDAVSMTSSTDLAPERNVWADVDASQARRDRELRHARRADESAVRFVNPSLVAPLDKLWLVGDDFSGDNGATTEPVAE